VPPRLPAQLHELDQERREQPDPDHEHALQDTAAPAQAQAQIPSAVGHEVTAAVDDERLLRRHDRDHRRGGHAPHPMAAGPHFEHRRIVRADVRKDPHDRAAASTRKRETDTVGEPVARHGARRIEAPALAQCNRHHARVPRYPSMRNSRL
jgi:hypothetical protein